MTSEYPGARYPCFAAFSHVTQAGCKGHGVALGMAWLARVFSSSFLVDIPRPFVSSWLYGFTGT